MRTCHCGHEVGAHNDLFGCTVKPCVCDCSRDEAMLDIEGCPKGHPWTDCGLVGESLSASAKVHFGRGMGRAATLHHPKQAA